MIFDWNCVGFIGAECIPIRSFVIIGLVVVLVLLIVVLIRLRLIKRG